MGRPSRRESCSPRPGQSLAICRPSRRASRCLATIANAPPDLAALLGDLARGRRGGAGPRQCGGVRLRRGPAGNGRTPARRPRSHRKPLRRSPAGARRLARRRSGHLHLRAARASRRAWSSATSGWPASSPCSTGSCASAGRTRIVVPLRLTFIFGLWVSLLAVRSGARLVLVSKFTPEGVAKTLADGGTVLAAVPTMLRSLLAGGADRRAGPAHDPHRRRDAGRGARRQTCGRRCRRRASTTSTA